MATVPLRLELHKPTQIKQAIVSEIIERNAAFANRGHGEKRNR